MADRWRVAQLLAEGMPYREIHENTGVSTATVTRVARALTYGEDGYRTSSGASARREGAPTNSLTENGKVARMREAERLRIAIQKSGRLAEKSIALFTKCGLDFDLRKDRLLHECKDFPIDLMLVRDDDIPEYVADGVCDLGVVGENVIREQPRTREGAVDRDRDPPGLRRLPAVARGAGGRRDHERRRPRGQAHRHVLSELPERVSRARTASRPRSSSSAAPSRSRRASRSPTPSATWFRPAARCARTACRSSQAVFESQAVLVRTARAVSAPSMAQRLRAPAAADRRRAPGRAVQVHHDERARARRSIRSADHPGHGGALRHAARHGRRADRDPRRRARERVLGDDREAKAVGASSILVLADREGHRVRILRWSDADAPETSGRGAQAARVGAERRSSRPPCARSSRTCARAAMRPCCELTERFDRVELERRCA